MKNLIVCAALLMCGMVRAEPVELVVDFKDDASWEQIHQAEKQKKPMHLSFQDEAS